MSALFKCLALFLLNWIDAELTIIWVRTGLATEGNKLMAILLNMGNEPFIITKLTVGALVAYAFYKWSHLRVAQFGLKISLGVYLLLMFIHASVGMVAMNGHTPGTATIAHLSYLPNTILPYLF
jgi:hypothetical protein